MNFDTTTLIIIGVALVAVALLVMLLNRGSRGRNEDRSRREAAPPPPTRPYVDSAPPREVPQDDSGGGGTPIAGAYVGDGPQGNAVTDEFAAATRDVAGDLLGVEAQPDIPAPAGPPDNLRLLKGVGPKLAAQLNENGVTRFDQLAALSPNEVEILDARMGSFRGRLARDRIPEQASYLARGDTDGFEAKFGKLGG